MPVKRSPLGPGAKSLARGSTFAAPPTPLRRTSSLKRSAMKATPQRIEGWSVADKGEPHCRVCGELADHLHHVVPRSVSPAGRDNLLNGLPLCWSCHREHHDGMPIPRSVFTPAEWAFIAEIGTASWLEHRYPLTDDVQTSPEIDWPLPYPEANV